MKKSLLLFVGLLLCFALPIRPAYGVLKLGVAILDFEVRGGISASQGETAYDFFRAEIVESKHFDVLERQRMEEIFKEVEFQLTGVTTTASAVEIGKILNVQKLILGSLGRFEGKPVINVRLVDVEKAKVQLEKRLQLRSEGDLALGIRHMAHLIIAAVPIEGRIIETEEDVVRLDLGSEHGLKVGDRLIAQGEGREIKDPQGRVIGYEREKLGYLKAREVSELWSKAKRERRNFIGKLLFWKGKEAQLETLRALREEDGVRTLFDERIIERERRQLEKVEILARSYFLGGGGSFKPRGESFEAIYGESQIYEASFHSNTPQYYDLLAGLRGSRSKAKADTLRDSRAKFDIATAVLGARVKYRLDLGPFLSIMPYLGIGAEYSCASEHIPSLREIWYGPGYETFWGVEAVYKHRIGIFVEKLRNFTKIGPGDVEIGGESLCFGLVIWR